MPRQLLAHFGTSALRRFGPRADPVQGEASKGRRAQEGEGPQSCSDRAPTRNAGREGRGEEGEESEAGRGIEACTDLAMLIGYK